MSPRPRCQPTHLENGRHDAPVEESVVLEIFMHPSRDLVNVHEREENSEKITLQNRMTEKHVTFTCWATFQFPIFAFAINVCAPSSSSPGCFLYASSYMAVTSSSGGKY